VYQAGNAAVEMAELAVKIAENDYIAFAQA
jgi:hypothetical protein